MANGGVYPMDQMQHLPGESSISYGHGLVWSGLVWGCSSGYQAATATATVNCLQSTR